MTKMSRHICRLLKSFIEGGYGFMIRTILLLGITILMGAVLISGGCSNAGTDEEPDLIGWIDNIQQPQGETPGRILINSPDNKTSDKFWVTVTDKTAIYKQTQNVGFDIFNIGQKVEIWFSGPVMESYPAQVSAGKIVIIEDSSPTAMPPLNDGAKSVLMEVSCEDFQTEPHITKEIEITYPGSLVVSLCANPTTGFEWEEVKIENESVIYQTGRNYVPPEADGVVGAAGKEVWSFNSGSSGTTTLIFEYSQLWEDGEKDEWTVGLTVVVKEKS
jgi:inhibitor of cysteine peptidase